MVGMATEEHKKHRHRMSSLEWHKKWVKKGVPRVTGTGQASDNIADDQAGDDKASDDKATDDKAGDNKASDDETSDDKATDDKASDDKVSDDKAGDHKVSDDKVIDFDGNATEDKATGNQVNNQDKARVTTSNKELPTAHCEFIKAWLSTTSEPKSRHRWKLANEAWMASAERAAAQARAGK
jgi:hypothetical protein